jgi:hypothetical protein
LSEKARAEWLDYRRAAGEVSDKTKGKERTAGLDAGDETDRDKGKKKDHDHGMGD